MRLDELFEVKLDLRNSGDPVVIDSTTDEPVQRTIKLSGFGAKPSPDAPSVRFLRDLEGMTHTNPIDPGSRVFDGDAVVSVFVGDGRKEWGNPDHAYIQDIRRMSKGGGSRALKELCWLADRHGVVLTLHAKGYGEVPTEKLVTLYERFGFRVIAGPGDNGGYDMERQPSDD